ncbi:MAG: hypothetical protein WCY92_11330 [Novosphingobium sp.]
MTLKDKFVRKNAAPATARQLEERAGEMETEIRDLSAERETIASSFAFFDADDMARLADVEALLPIKQRALEAVRAAEREARQREAIEAFQADRTSLDRTTDKAAKTFRTRYEKAAAEMVSVLEELRASHDAWETMARRGRELGIAAPGGAHLERRVRGDQLTGPTARLLFPDARIFGWNGVQLWGR